MAHRIIKLKPGDRVPPGVRVIKVLRVKRGSVELIILPLLQPKALTPPSPST